MKKITVLLILAAFILGACLPTPAPNNPVPTVDIAGTVDSIAKTAVAQTQTALPSPTSIPPSDTFTPTETSVLADVTGTNTDTPVPNLTTTPATATSGSGDAVTTFTSTSLPAGAPTLTPTLGILLYGTQPPLVPYTEVTLVNVSKREAYISLQTRVEPWGQTVLEYPVQKWARQIQAPIGDYAYVVWVGGKQIVGYFHLGVTPLIITIYKDKVEVSKVSYP